MHIREFEYRVEKILRETIAEKYPLDWKEDSITHTLLPRLRNQFSEIDLYGLRFPLSIKWEAYKLHGKPETKHGDIGVLIRYLLPNGRTIEGAGFLEAKARGRNSTKFPQAKPAQLNRILKGSPLAQLLLYDYNEVAIIDDTDDYWRSFPSLESGYNLVARTTNCPVLPINLAVGIGQYDDSLYRFCHSLGHQFVRRFFQLLDLDFSKDAIDAVKGFPASIQSPRYIMVIRITQPGKTIEEFRLDQAKYTVLE